MGRIRMIAMVAAMTAVSAGCTSKTRPSSAGGDAFSGSWVVRWCDESRSEEDCGGFWLTLVQKGRHVCGEYDGAWMNLTQVDEGRVTGVVHGDSATLRVRSNRNQALVEAEVRRIGNSLHWKQGDTIEPGGSDVAIIANQEILEDAGEGQLRAPEECNL
jgi:hypothetical protein